MQDLLEPLIKIAVFLLMLAVGLDCSLGGFRQSLRRPVILLVVTLIQFVGIPVLVLAVVNGLGLEATVATALLLVAACPSGSISNAFTFMARGDTALSVTLTGVSNLVALGATPLALMAIRKFGGDEVAGVLSFPPGPLVQQLVISMVLPLVIGLVVRHKFDGRIGPRLPVLRKLCGVLIVGIILLMIFTNARDVWEGIQALVMPALLITPLLFGLSWSVGTLCRGTGAERRAILFELPCRNVALAMLVALSILEKPAVAFASVGFFVLETSLILLLLWWMGSRNPERDTPAVPH